MTPQKLKRELTEKLYAKKNGARREEQPEGVLTCILSLLVTTLATSRFYLTPSNRKGRDPISSALSL